MVCKCYVARVHIALYGCKIEASDAVADNSGKFLNLAFLFMAGIICKQYGCLQRSFSQDDSRNGTR